MGFFVGDSSGIISVLPKSAPPPAPKTDVVRPGDTVQSVAQRHGVSAQSLAAANHIAPESVLVVGQSLIIPEGPDSFAGDDSAPTQAAPIRPEDARTPQEAVQAIHDMPLPDTSDLAGMPSDVLDAVYGPRVEGFNKSRVAAAQATLDRFEPKRSDYAGAGNSRTADIEYQQAVEASHNDPYLNELRRIVEEGTEHPNQIPAYLTSGERSSAAAPMPVDQLRTVMSQLGLDLPANASPEQINDAYQIVATVPEEVLSYLVNPGMQVSYSTPVIGAGTPSFIPARANWQMEVTGQVALSDVTTGTGLQQTQQFEMTVQTQGGVGFEFGRTPLNAMYKWGNRLNMLPPDLKAKVEGSPLLRNVVNGLPIPVSGSYQTFAGARLKFEAVVTPEQGKRLDAGDMSGVPNPLDPLNMPTGTSVMIRGQALQGTAFEASFKLLQSNGSHTTLDGMGFGVRRLEGSVVEVYSGPVKTVENSLYLGLGKPGLSVGVSAEFSDETQQMSVARIDLSTSEGQAAYQRFISTGEVPGWNPPGVQQAGKSEIYNGEHAAKLGIELGPLSVGIGNKSQLTITRTTWEDGTIEQQNTYVAGPDYTTDITTTIGADGKPIDSQTTWSLVMGNYSPNLTSYLADAYSPTGKSSYGSFDGNQSVQLTFTSSELLGLRSQARDLVLKGQGPDRVNALESGKAQPTNPLEALVAAKTPEEIFGVLAKRGPGNLAMDLGALAGQTHQPVPGQIMIRDAG